jgi:GDP-L-fucose synthase
LFVRDAARGIVAAAERYNDADPVNIGSGSEITIRELAQLICNQCDYRGALRFDPQQPDGQPRRCLDTSRAWDRFGFRATTPLIDGLRETIEWYRESLGVLPHAA